MSIREGSTVPSGANPFANILLIKTSDVDRVELTKALDMTEPHLMQEILDYREAVTQWHRLVNAFEDSVTSIMNNGGSDKPKLLQQTVEQFSEAAEMVMPRLQEKQVDTIRGAVTALYACDTVETMRVGLLELRAAFAPGPGDDPGQGGLTMPKAKADPKVQDPKPVAKVDPEPLPPKDKDGDGKVIQLSKSEHDGILKQNEDLRKRIEKMEQETLTKEYVEKAVPYEAIGLERGVFGPMLMKMSQALTKEEYDEFVRVLDSLKEQAKLDRTLTRTIGKAGGADGDGAEPVRKLDELAKARAKEKGINFFAAYDEVSQENPEIYEEHRKQVSVQE